MLIRVFPPHYQLVYISFDISSFSVISYSSKVPLLHGKSDCFASQNSRFCIAKPKGSLFNKTIFTKTRWFFCACFQHLKESHYFNNFWLGLLYLLKNLCNYLSKRLLSAAFYYARCRPMNLGCPCFCEYLFSI